ncbi:MAG TPA: chemotaxis protein CheB [Candidatus Binatia bacterium]|jgi:two-component system CheB/CheR fusion protein|nr:chemotaxis protein CheB [Candidatus Binatia bacterium]
MGTASQSAILHVEDDEAKRFVVSRLLQQAGFVVHEASTGQDALRLAAAQPALVLLDVKLPDINGIEVCRQLKANPLTAGIPVLHYSAVYTQPEDKVQGLENGAAGYLTGDMEPTTLLATIQALLRARRPEETREQSLPQSRGLIVGLGASAGGLEAFEQFFAQMPPDSGLAFVLVQHLAPDHASLLPELLAKHTRMPVQQVQEETPVAPNHVYVIPPDASLTIDRGVLHVVSPPVEPRGRRTLIDSFFRSLAEDQGEYAVCILFSGTGTDGTLGLNAVKEYGGMAMAQTPASTRYDSIVRSAIATGLVDHILPVEEMPAKLIEYVTHLTALRETNGPAGLHQEEMSHHLHTICGLLKRQTGHDFSQYKEGTLVRRLRRRMQALQLDAVDAYVALLRQEPTELDFLFKDLLIGVTQFFRDPEDFAVLAREVLPQLFADKGADDQVRVCACGCASGEEAYSLAILLREHMAKLDVVPHVQVFATDINAQALEIARHGCYPAGIADHVTPERLARFFVKRDNAYQVTKELREMCLFSVHNLIKDPPFSRLDLISCRNVLIYLGAELQQKLMRLFHYALRPGGYLFLGPAETLTQQSELFRPLYRKQRIFQKKGYVSRPPVEFPLTDVRRSPSRPGEELERTPDERTLGKLVERTILETYAPACVVTNAQGNAVYFSGRTGQYLEPPTGTPNLNVINMARAGLQLPLRTALQQAVTTHQRVVQEQIQVQANGGVQTITLVVQPVTELGDDDNLYLVIFQDLGPAQNTTQAAADAPVPGPEDAHIRSLEHELRATRERLQATIEELETANEELSSANEEFQSTNEELETSKEELQSLNEELETVNAELQRKVEDLDHTNSDLQNLLDSSQVATVFLDRELRIRSFTPATSAVLPLRPGDVGRPLTDLAQRFADADLANDAKAVLKTLAWTERSLRTTDTDDRYLMRIFPYRTIENVIDGVVLTFVDVTDLKRAEEAAHAAQAYAEGIVDTVREPLLVLDAHLRVRSANRSFYEVFHTMPAQTEGRLLYELDSGQWDIPELRRLLEKVLPQHHAFEGFEVVQDFTTIGWKTMLLNARQVSGLAHDSGLILLAIEDVSERKRAENALVQRTADLQRVNEELQQFAHIVSHDLNEPLRMVSSYMQRLEERYRGKLDTNADDYIAFAIEGAQRMQALIQDLLAYTRVGGKAQEFTAVDCEVLLLRTLGDLQLAIEESGAAVTHGPLPTVRGEGKQLGLVFQNLIGNALKFRSQAPPRIHISARRDGSQWVFAVQDNGIGIDPRHVARIFQVFQRLHTRSEYPGTGIGLSICKKIVERHGGRIWVESELGKGATFLFTLSAL